MVGSEQGQRERRRNKKEKWGDYDRARRRADRNGM